MFTPSMQLYYQFEVHDIRTGKLIRKSRRYRARSFVTQYMQHLIAMFSFVNEANVKDTGGTDRTIDVINVNNIMTLGAAATVITFGFRVGTGTTAVTMTDNKLQTEIAEGSSSGQLLHALTDVGTLVETSTEASVIIFRNFTNSSGGNITVTETGIYGKSKDTGGTDRFFMLVRDVLTSSVTVNNGQVLTVTYTIKVTT